MGPEGRPHGVPEEGSLRMDRGGSPGDLGVHLGWDMATI